MSRAIACRGHEAHNLFLYACYVSTSIQNKSWYVKLKRPWGQNVSLLQNLEVIYILSIIN